jgi:hypothetical protein
MIMGFGGIGGHPAILSSISRAVEDLLMDSENHPNLGTANGERLNTLHFQPITKLMPTLGALVRLKK